MLVVGACGGSSDGEPASKSGDAAALASLVIIDRDTSVRVKGLVAFRGGTEGEGLGVGDTVQTSETGFAEVSYFDGSLTRIDRSGEFTLIALSDAGEAKRVKGSLVDGRAWSRVERAVGPDDEFTIDTPVASATVRGTAFSIDCTETGTCTFTVVEGVVEVTPTASVPIVVSAGERLLVRQTERPRAPSSVDAAELAADPWIARNTERDAKSGSAPATASTSPSTTSGEEEPLTGIEGELVRRYVDKTGDTMTNAQMRCVGAKLVEALDAGDPFAANTLKSGERDFTADEIAMTAQFSAECS